MDPLDFSQADDNHAHYGFWYNGYFCTKCKEYKVSSCTPDLPTPRIADHIAKCGISHFWWTDNPHPKMPKAFETLTEIGILGLLIKVFKKLDETKMDFEVSQQAIAELTNKLRSTMQTLEAHQMRHRK